VVVVEAAVVDVVLAVVVVVLAVVEVVGHHHGRPAALELPGTRTSSPALARAMAKPALRRLRRGGPSS
jgi:hypothetical protein